MSNPQLALNLIKLMRQKLNIERQRRKLIEEQSQKLAEIERLDKEIEELKNEK